MIEEKPSKVKIFVGYYKPNFVFNSDVYQPILTARTDWNPEGIIRDDSGDNIANKNEYYGELSGHYWVWKNFMPKTDSEYIGFCHYRRFLNFGITPMPEIPFKPILAREFKKVFPKYTEENILKCIDGYDIVLPHPQRFSGMLYSQYLSWHPKDDMNLALNIIRDNFPDYAKMALDVMSKNQMHSCLNFIIKKELLNEYFEWIFGLFDILETKTDWSKYKEYSMIRTPAFIAERFFNIWVAHVVAQKNLKVLHTTSNILVGKEYGPTTYKEALEAYEFAIESGLYPSSI